MRPYRSLRDPATVDELVQRLGRLSPASARQWGKMTPHQMLCHLSDSFEAVTGARPASRADTWFYRNVAKYIALHTSLPWPKGVATRPEVEQGVGGTPPVEFERDRARVVEWLRRFVRPDTQCVPHPIFGPMTREEWMLWSYGHVDHHLRQFGV